MGVLPVHGMLRRRANWALGDQVDVAISIVLSYGGQTAMFKRSGPGLFNFLMSQATLTVSSVSYKGRIALHCSTSNRGCS